MARRSLRKIKDPIHQYVYYSLLEENLINHPLVLRLHHIRQNGAAFLTYPSIRVHRFEHSIGTMHIAGQLYLSGTRFSNDSNLQETYKNILLQLTGKKSIKEIRDDVLNADQNYSRGRPTAIHDDPLYRLHHLDELEKDDVFIQLVFFQATRLAALIHDVGHPPFSHTFETALKQLELKRYRDHEVVGVEILKHLFADLTAFTHAVTYYFGKLIIPIAEAIFDKENKNHEFVKGLAEIVSGNIDADRLDYVRRDAIAAGLTTNAYDLGRLFDAVKLKTSAGKGIELEWTADALSTFEAFFSVRFHLYRWALWHHHVVRQNMALILVIKLIWRLTASRNSILKNSGADFDELVKISTDTKNIDQYWFFTDYYLLEKFSKVLRYLVDNKSLWIGNKDVDWGELADLYKFLRTFMFREKKWLAPFWKRPANYENFSKLVVGGEQGNYSQVFNRQLAEAFKHFEREVIERERPEIAGDQVRIAEVAKDFKDYVTGKFSDHIESLVNVGLKSLNLKIRAYYLSKFNPAPMDMKLTVMDDGAREEYSLPVLSPSIGALQEAWMALPQLWLFLEYRAFGEDGSSISPEAEKDKSKPSNVYDLVAKSLRTLLETAPKGNG